MSRAPEHRQFELVSGDENVRVHVREARLEERLLGRLPLMSKRHVSNKPRQTGRWRNKVETSPGRQRSGTNVAGRLVWTLESHEADGMRRTG